MGGEETVSVGWQHLAGRKVLKVAFGRELDVDRAREAAGEMVAMAMSATEGVGVVWDCSRMESYTARAFEVWRDHLLRIREAVEAVHRITNSTFIRMGAVALGLSRGRRVTIWGSEAEIEL